MGLFGDLVTDALGGFPKKPKVPDWQDISLATQQGKAIDANLAALPGAEQLVSRSNAFSQDQISKMLQNVIPNYSALTSKSGSNIEAMLRGEIPSDVKDQIQTSDAARALSGGYSGSGMHGDLVARDLGLTSLHLTQQGLSSAESWISMMDSMFAPSQLSVKDMFISPTQMFQTTFANQAEKWNVQWLKNQLKALPDPATAAIARDVGGIVDSVGSSVGNYVGGGAGGMISLASGSSGGGGGGGGGGL